MTSFARRIDVQLWAPLLLFAGFLVLRIPFRAEFLVNWDSVNFALGTHEFNLENHQPHPPGYIGYIALGWVLNNLTGDANTSLTWISIISGAVAASAFYLFASLFLSWRYAFISAVLFGLSPVVWYYSEVALTYSVELALALVYIWAAFKARQDRSIGHLITATMTLVLIGAMRQSGALFLMPLWLYVVWPFAWRARLTVLTILVVGNIAWFVPLMWLSGGLSNYMRVSSELAGLVVMPTSVFSLGSGGMSQNLGYVLAGIVVGVNLGLIFIAAGVYRGARPFSLFIRHRAFFLLWLVPILLTYLLLHTGQIGYVLMLMPPVFLAMGATLADFCEGRPAMSLRAAAMGGGRLMARHYASIAIVAVLAITNVAAFLYLPRVVQAFATTEESSAERGGVANAVHLFKLEGHGSGLVDRARQYNLHLNDMHWEAIVALVNETDPSTTVLLTAPNWEGSFRHLTYYLPEYRVYGIGNDIHGNFGLLFTSYRGGSNYAVKGLESALPELTLHPEVTTLIIPDREVYERIRGVNTIHMQMEGGAEIAIALVTPGTTLWFE